MRRSSFIEFVFGFRSVPLSNPFVTNFKFCVLQYICIVNNEIKRGVFENTRRRESTEKVIIFGEKWCEKHGSSILILFACQKGLINFCVKWMCFLSISLFFSSAVGYEHDILRLWILHKFNSHFLLEACSKVICGRFCGHEWF